MKFLLAGARAIVQQFLLPRIYERPEGGAKRSTSWGGAIIRNFH